MNIFVKIKNLFEKQPVAVQAFFCGALSAISFEPTRSIITFCLGIIGILHILNTKSPSLKDCFYHCLAFFYAYFFIGLHWIHFCFLSVDLWFVIPLAMIVFPLIFMFFTLWVPFVTWKVQNTALIAVIFPLCFWGVELMIGHLCTGLPWLLSAYVINDYAMQVGAYFGAYGTSFLTLMWCSQFYRAKKVKIILLITLFCLLNGVGFYRLHFNSTAFTTQKVRLVHPNIEQKHKMDGKFIVDNFEKHAAFLKKGKGIDLFLWPEASLPIPFNKYDSFIHYIQEHMPENSLVVAGSPFVAGGKIYTSAYIIDKQKGVLDVYHKNHLVPFGEYLPFRWFLEKVGFKKLTSGNMDYCEGKNKPLYSFKNFLDFSILICYEVIFPNQLFDEKNSTPKCFLNMTNDAWYYGSSGIYQHLHIVRWRALEEGIPIIRTANSGVSCVIDAFGRIVESIAPDQCGYLDAYVPKALNGGTFYQKMRGFITHIFAF